MVDYQEMYKPDSDGVMQRCHISESSGGDYPVDCAFDDLLLPADGAPVRAEVDRASLGVVGAGAWSPLKSGAYDGYVSGGGAFGANFAFNHTQADAVTSPAFTEYVELRFDEPVYVVAVQMGMPRGMGAVVAIRAREPWHGQWVPIYVGEPQQVVAQAYAAAGKYWEWSPEVCRVHFPVLDLRFELDTAAIDDWNYIDYVKLVIAARLNRVASALLEGCERHASLPRPHGWVAQLLGAHPHAPGRPPQQLDSLVWQQQAGRQALETISICALKRRALLLLCHRQVGSREQQPGAVPYGRQAVVYAPEPHANGIDSFSYAASDCAGLGLRTSLQQSTVQFEMIAKNDPPGDAAGSFVVPLGADAVSFGLQVSDVDDLDPLLSITLVALPAFGTLYDADGLAITSAPHELGIGYFSAEGASRLSNLSRQLTFEAPQASLSGSDALILAQAAELGSAITEYALDTALQYTVRRRVVPRACCPLRASALAPRVRS